MSSEFKSLCSIMGPRGISTPSLVFEDLLGSGMIRPRPYVECFSFGKTELPVAFLHSYMLPNAT